MGGELWGTYDEREAARSFKEAVREWRGGDETSSSASSLSVAYATSASNAALRPSDADGDKVHSVAGSVSRGSPTEATGPSSRAANSAARRARRRTRRRGDSNRRRRHHPGEEPRVSVASTCATPTPPCPPPEVASSAPRRVQSRPARRHPHHRPDRRLPRARRGTRAPRAKIQTGGSAAATTTAGASRACAECGGPVDLLRGAVGVVIAGLGSRMCCGRACAEAAMAKPSSEEEGRAGESETTRDGDGRG